MITIENHIDHPGLTKIPDLEAERIGSLLKQSVRHRQPALIRWYIDQLADHYLEVDRIEAKQAKEEAEIQAAEDEIARRRPKDFCDKPSPHPAHGDCEGVPNPPQAKVIPVPVKKKK